MMGPNEPVGYSAAGFHPVMEKVPTWRITVGPAEYKVK